MLTVYKLTTSDNKTRKGCTNECTWGLGDYDLRWRYKGFVIQPETEFHQGVVFYQDMPTLCPDCGSNVNVEEHGPFHDIENNPRYPSYVTHECQLGCGHSTFII
jgi:acetone carboxylase gamma subunit